MTWLFWVITAALTAGAVALLIHPLLRRPRAAAASAAYNLTVYKDQLAEVDRDLERGVINEQEAASARLEIERRLLTVSEAEGGAQAAAETGSEAEGGAQAAAETGRKAGSGWRRGTLPAAGLALLVPLAGLGLYLLGGSPELPSQPLAERRAELEQTRELVGLIDGLRTRLAQEPDDPRGWELLGRSYAELGRYDLAADAYETAIEKGGDAAALQSAFGEALVFASDGVIGPKAEAAFARALEADPGEPRARFYEGLALQQKGKTREALDAWIALVGDSPADAPWRPMLMARIGRVAEGLGLSAAELDLPAAPAPPVASGAPDGEAVAALEAMSPEEQEAFIRSMVERLATRMEENPEDVEGWLRLGRAYLVLGERAEAIAALERARPLIAERPADDPQRRLVEETLRQLGDG